MYTISFDESSGFEKFARDPRVPIMVAGVVYNDNGENDGYLNGKELERERLIAYFKAVCQKEGATFPNDLHLFSSNKKSHTLQKELFSTLKEYICKGTYQNKGLIAEDNKVIPPRKGHYQICALLKTDESGKMVGDPLFKDDEASGNYLNMVITLIKDCVFLNSEINEEKPRVKFEFPTRVMPNNVVGQAAREYEGRYVQGTASKKVMTSGDRFYAAKVGEFIHRIRPIEVVGGIFPSEIVYEGRGTDFHEYAFMYLADILVGYLKYGIFDSVYSNSQQKKNALIEILDKSKVPPNEDAELLISTRKNIIERARGFGKIDLTLIPNENKCKDPQIKEILNKMKTVLKKMEQKEQQYYKSSIKAELDEVYSILEKALNSGTLNNNEHNLIDSLLTKIIDWEDRYKIPNLTEFRFDNIGNNQQWKKVVEKKILKLNHPDQAKYFLEILARSNELNPNVSNCIRCYDIVDTYVESAFNSLRTKDIYGVHACIYDALYTADHFAKDSNQIIRDYYKGDVFDQLEKAVNENVDRKMLQTFVDQLISDRFSNNLRLGKFIYLYEKANQARIILEEKGGFLTNKYLFRLFDIGFSAYMHAGQTSLAIACYDECMKIDGISKDEKNLVKVRCITMYNDLLDYKKAEKLGLEILGIKKEAPQKETILQKFKHALKEAIMGDSESGNQTEIYNDIGDPVIYKAASSIGQTYSFMNNPLAVEFFNKVLAYRRVQDDPDFYITVSYCLHWYIENRELEKYEALAKEYFGGHTELSDQLDYLIKEGIRGEKISLPYALYVFIKAFYVFYKDDEAELEVLKKLTHIDKTINTVLDKPLDPYPTVRHPWEMIYKYAALLEEKDKTVKAGTNIQKSKNATAGAAKGEIVDLVTRYGIMEYKEKRIANGHKNKDSEKSLVKQVEEIWTLTKNNSSLCSAWTEEDGDYRFKRDKLRDMFTYMYH